MERIPSSTQNIGGPAANDGRQLIPFYGSIPMTDRPSLSVQTTARPATSIMPNYGWICLLIERKIQRNQSSQSYFGPGALRRSIRSKIKNSVRDEPMATADLPKTTEIDAAKLRDEWLSRLTDLIETVKNWVEELGWSTRRIEKRMQDREIGSYIAPSLLFQIDTDRVLLEPVGRSAPGAEGVVDLYLMPAYDDIASLYYSDGSWQCPLHVPRIADCCQTTRLAESQPLSKEDPSGNPAEMRKHAGSTV